MSFIDCSRSCMNAPLCFFKCKTQINQGSNGFECVTCIYNPVRCTCRQPGGAAEFETTCSGAGGRERRSQTDGSSSECGAEPLPNTLQNVVQAGGNTSCRRILSYIPQLLH